MTELFCAGFSSIVAIIFKFPPSTSPYWPVFQTRPALVGDLLAAGASLVFLSPSRQHPVLTHTVRLPPLWGPAGLSHFCCLRWLLLFLGEMPNP